MQGMSWDDLNDSLLALEQQMLCTLQEALHERRFFVRLRN